MDSTAFIVLRRDMLDAAAERQLDFIVQQCNCLTTLAHGLSQSIAMRLGTWADPYSKRRPEPGVSNVARVEDRPLPGTLRVLASTSEGSLPVAVACLFAQWAPGHVDAAAKSPAKYPRLATGPETRQQRLAWFQSALIEFREHVEMCRMRESFDRFYRIGIPWRIGCGLGGGDWADYKLLLENELGPLVIAGHSVVLYQPQQ